MVSNGYFDGVAKLFSRKWSPARGATFSTVNGAGATCASQREDKAAAVGVRRRAVPGIIGRGPLGVKSVKALPRGREGARARGREEKEESRTFLGGGLVLECKWEELPWPSGRAGCCRWLRWRSAPATILISAWFNCRGRERLPRSSGP